MEALGKSSTLYVGNLSFYTTEEQLYELFSKAGDIKKIIMGLDRNSKTPCGFCFLEYVGNRRMWGGYKAPMGFNLEYNHCN